MNDGLGSENKKIRKNMHQNRDELAKEQSRRREKREEEREFEIRTLSHSLTRMLRHQLNREHGNFTVDEARRVAKMQLCRQGRPASALGIEARIAFDADLQGFAEELKDPTRPAELARFARNCVRAAFKRQSKKRVLGERVAKGEHLLELAKAAIKSEYLGASTDANVVQRAVTRLIRERRRGQRGFAGVPLDDKDVIRELLDLPKYGKLALPSADIRVHLARAVSGTSAVEVGRRRRKKLPKETSPNAKSLGETLRHAALFSEVHLQDALGEELLLLGRPVGFTDSRRRAVLFEVRSSAAAHLLNMRRQELIYRLQQVSGFESVRDIRTEVRTLPRPRILSSGSPRQRPKQERPFSIADQKYGAGSLMKRGGASHELAVGQKSVTGKMEQAFLSESEEVKKPVLNNDSTIEGGHSSRRLQEVIARLRARSRGEIE